MNETQQEAKEAHRTKEPDAGNTRANETGPSYRDQVLKEVYAFFETQIDELRTSYRELAERVAELEADRDSVVNRQIEKRLFTSRHQCGQAMASGELRARRY
jgi:hypothetical protein